MNQTQVKMVSLKSVSVFACEIVKSSIWYEESKCDETVWGIKVAFSDGNEVFIPDLCTREAEAKQLKQRLVGASLYAHSLPDIVDDYLGELYGERYC